MPNLLSFLDKLPTDNLYKFMTVLGLALIVVCPYILMSNLSSLERDTVHLSRDTQKLLIVVDYIEQDIAELSESKSEFGDKTTDLEDEINSLSIVVMGKQFTIGELMEIDLDEIEEYYSDRDPDELQRTKRALLEFKDRLRKADQRVNKNHEELNQIMEKVTAIREINRQMRINLPGLEARAKLLKLRNSDLRLLYWPCFLGTLLGLCLTVYGSYLWYYKLQIPLDRKIQREVKNKHI